MHKFEHLFNEWQILEYKLRDLRTIVQNDIIIPEEGIEKWKYLANKFNAEFVELSKKTVFEVVQNNKEKQHAKMGK